MPKSCFRVIFLRLLQQEFQEYLRKKCASTSSQYEAVVNKKKSLAKADTADQVPPLDLKPWRSTNRNENNRVNVKDKLTHDL